MRKKVYRSTWSKCRPSSQIVDINLHSSGHSIGCILANNFVATANANSNSIIMLDLRIKF